MAVTPEQGFLLIEEATADSNAPFVFKELRRCLHEFREAVARGALGEMAIDRFLEGRGCVLEEAPSDLQYYGVDRICIQEIGGLPVYRSLEYKTDHRAADTGNLFIETQIRERDGSITPGWLRKTVAQVIVFYLPQTRRIIFMEAIELREWIFCFGKDLRQTGWVENKGGYAGKGLLLPISTAQQNLCSFIEMGIDDGRRRAMVEAVPAARLGQ